jgi:hypothetical protein
VPGVVAVTAGVLLIAFYALCGYGIVLVARRRESLLAHAFVIGIAGYVILTSAGPEAFGGRGERFRAPIMPILILYAALGAQAVHRRVARRRRAATQTDRPKRRLRRLSVNGQGAGVPSGLPS